MALDNYQIEYRGVTMGPDTDYDLIKIEGIHDITVRDTDRDNPRTHGVIPGIHSASYRLIRVQLEVVKGTSSISSYAADVQTLLNALSPDQHMWPSETDDQLTFKFPGEDKSFLYCRPVRRTRPRRVDTEYGFTPIKFELKTYDPRIYSTTLDDSGTQLGAFSVTNNGGALAYPIITCKVDTLGGMFITNNQNDSIFSLAGFSPNESGIIADMGRWVRGRGDLLIVYKGTTNYYPEWQIPRNPFYLSPGVNSLQLTVSADAEVVIESRDTWM